MKAIYLLVVTNVISLLGTAPLVKILGRQLLVNSPSWSTHDVHSLARTIPVNPKNLRNLQTTCCVCNGGDLPASAPLALPSVPPSVTPSTSPSLNPSLSPSLSNSASPTSAPSAPTLYPSAAPTATIPFTVVLAANTKLTHDNPGVSSPNGLYFFRMGGSDFDDDLLLVRRQQSQGDAVIWRVNSGIQDIGANGTTTLFMQGGGNMVLRAANFTTLWKTETGKSPGAYLILDDDGQMAIVLDEDDPSGGAGAIVRTRIWFDGRPKGFYRDSSVVGKQNIEFPVRGAFYYPWFPETWTIEKQPTKYNATLGKYSSGRAATYDNHLDALSYARIDLAIASWFGPNSNLDRARIHNLLQRSPPNLKWTIYHEDEMGIDPNALEIRTDLNYLKYWFAWHESWAHIDGRPVVFVYNEPNDCGVSERWMTASRGEWYVVLKLFKGFTDCPVQPDSWHQYGPAAAINYNRGHSVSISPGFWKAGQDEPALARLSEEEWRGNVAKMVERNEQWQLVTTFNEWGEGTSVESGTEWESDSGYGYYLDALHDIH